MKKLKKIGLFVMLIIIGLIGGMGGSLKQAEVTKDSNE